jgi:hypothetical protein
MSRTATDLARLAAALVGATLIAELLGAANLGTALTAGELAFTATLLWIILGRARSPQPETGPTAGRAG